MGFTYYSKYKYKIDRLAAIILLLILFPFLLLISFILIIELKTNPILIQKRGLSLTNSCFKIYKFRTLKKYPKHKCETGDVFYKKELMEYVSKFGKWLRYTGIDELPQLINIIKGEMSFVGPRPFMIQDLISIKEKNPEEYKIRNGLTSKPGLTGRWQVFGNRHHGIDDLITHEIFYESNISFKTDLKIFLATIPLVFKGKLSDAILNGINKNAIIEFQEIKTISKVNEYINLFSLGIISMFFF